MKTKILLGLIFLLAISGFVFWQREKIFPQKLQVPVVSREPTVVLAQELEKAGLNFTGLPVANFDSIEASISGVRVFFDINKDFSTQVRALQLILARRTIDKMPREIDLRFNNVVIKY